MHLPSFKAIVKEFHYSFTLLSRVVEKEMTLDRSRGRDGKLFTVCASYTPFHQFPNAPCKTIGILFFPLNVTTNHDFYS